MFSLPCCKGPGTDLCIVFSTSESASLVIVCRMTKRMCAFQIFILFFSDVSILGLCSLTVELACAGSYVHVLIVQEQWLDQLWYLAESHIVTD